MDIPSIFRHWFTLAATAFTLWLVSTLLLSVDDADAIAAAAGRLVEPLVIIFTLVVAALWRMALTWLSKLFRNGAGETGEIRPGSGGGLACVCIGTAAAFFGLALPSCSNVPPVRACVTWHEITACFSPANSTK